MVESVTQEINMKKKSTLNKCIQILNYRWQLMNQYQSKSYQNVNASTAVSIILNHKWMYLKTENIFKFPFRWVMDLYRSHIYLFCIKGVLETRDLKKHKIWQSLCTRFTRGTIYLSCLDENNKTQRFFYDMRAHWISKSSE